MEVDLKNIQWGEFEIGEEFVVKNSKAYHKTNLKESKKDGISYVSRTNLNNGIESIVKKEGFKINQKNTIVFGAENATFFYQPNEYITGNKMYLIEKDKLNKFSGLFIQMMLNKSIVNCGFGYGKGLIGSRVKKRFILLPKNSKGKPDYAFMEQFMRQKEQEKIEKFQNYIAKRIEQVKDFKEVEPLNQKEWGEFFIEDIAQIISGRDIYEAERIKGDIPYVSATANNNGIGYFVGNTNETLEENCLSVNRNGSVGYSFYHQYKTLFSNDCRKLCLRNKSPFVGKFISKIITGQKDKYGYGYKMGTGRIKRQKILLPINKTGQPDYDYMENYIKKLEHGKLTNYLNKKQRILNQKILIKRYDLI